MKNIRIKLKEKVPKQIKKIFYKEINMKLLVSYLIANLIYLLVGSYIYFTEKIIKGFHYKEYSVGLKYLFIANLIVFLIIIIKKKYKKNNIHIGIAVAAIFRNYFNYICI